MSVPIHRDPVQYTTGRVLPGSPCCLLAGHTGEHAARLGYSWKQGDCGYTGILFETGFEQ